MEPDDGRKPTTPQKEAGFRNDPPRSDPSARDSEPQARAAAAPPLEPPEVRVGSQGLRVVPNTGLKVCEPDPSSGVLVLPTDTMPLARIAVTKGWSLPGTWSA